MKNLLLPLSFLFAAPVLAEPIIAYQKIACNEWQIVSSNLKKDYGEVPFVRGDGSINLPNGNVPGEMIIFMNPTTKTFTLVIRLGPEPEAPTCAISVGDQFSPATSKEFEQLREGKIKS